MNRVNQVLLALSLAAASVGTSAQQRYADRHDQPDDLRNDMARVTRVERMGNVYGSHQRQECWNARSGRAESGYYRDDRGRLYRGDGSSKSGTIIGALVGGALGNQVGHGDGRAAATIAGVVIGGMIGNEHDRDNRNDGYADYRDSAGTVRRCRNIAGYDNAWRRGGYKVTYAYGGQSYETYTRSRPGRKIRVLVDVRPDHRR